MHMSDVVVIIVISNTVSGAHTIKFSSVYYIVS